MTKYKFSDIFSFESKSKLKAGDGLVDGLFPFYTSSFNVTKRTDIASYDKGSLVFGTGGKASVHFANERFSTSSDCLVATIKDSRVINPKYVYYYLVGNIHVLEQGFKGAGLQHISKKYIEEINIPALPLDVQNKIVLILDRVSLLISHRQEGIKLLDELVISKFIDMFGDPITNKRSWSIRNLGEVATLQRGKFSARPRNDPTYFNGKYPFIQTGDISNSNHRLDSYTQTLNEKGISVSKEFTSGTIVIAIVGATIGATSILMIDTYATDSMIGISTKDGIINNVFLEMLLRFYRPVLKDRAPEGDKPNINLKILEPLQIIQPPIELQENFEFIYSEIEKTKKSLRLSSDNLNELFFSIIDKSFTGRLNVDVSVEVDSILESIEFHCNSSLLNPLVSDVTYLNNFVDRVNDKGFESVKLYEIAKNIAFYLLKNDEFIEQRYDETSKELRLFLK